MSMSFFSFQKKIGFYSIVSFPLQWERYYGSEPNAQIVFHIHYCYHSRAFFQGHVLASERYGSWT